MIKGLGLFWGEGNVEDSPVCEYARNYSIVHFKWVNCTYMNRNPNKAVKKRKKKEGVIVDPRDWGRD